MTSERLRDEARWHTVMGDRASEQGNHSTAQCHYENARKYESEAIKFDDLQNKWCEE